MQWLPEFIHTVSIFVHDVSYGGCCYTRHYLSAYRHTPILCQQSTVTQFRALHGASICPSVTMRLEQCILAGCSTKPLGPDSGQGLRSLSQATNLKICAVYCNLRCWSKVSKLWPESRPVQVLRHCMDLLTGCILYG